MHRVMHLGQVLQVELGVDLRRRGVGVTERPFRGTLFVWPGQLTTTPTSPYKLAMRIFLSHASQSKALVKQLVERLPRHVEVWLDQDELEAGQQFPEHIERGIRLQCDYVILFIDEAALDSNWVRRESELALQRQADLQRAFVVPVLLGDVAERLGELKLHADQVIYIDARDHSPAGIEDAGRQLAAELFKLASRLVESLRHSDRRSVLDEFSAELAAFEQAAFLWLASMGNSYGVLATNQAAFDHVAQCLKAYNDVADAFIPRLAVHRDRLSAGWRESRSLVKHVHALLDFIDDDVYRGALYRINGVLQTINQLAHAGMPDQAGLTAADAEKTALIATARSALEKMSTRASEVTSDLMVELGG
jgi:hypothetical protein